jgi:hypothetical protein
MRLRHEETEAYPSLVETQVAAMVPPRYWLLASVHSVVKSMSPVVKSLESAAANELGNVVVSVWARLMERWVPTPTSLETVVQLLQKGRDKWMQKPLA